MRNVSYPYSELLGGFRYPDAQAAMSAILRLQHILGGIELMPEEGKKLSKGELIREGFVLIKDSKTNQWGIGCENRAVAEKVRDQIRENWP